MPWVVNRCSQQKSMSNSAVSKYNFGCGIVRQRNVFFTTDKNGLHRLKFNYLNFFLVQSIKSFRR